MSIIFLKLSFILEQFLSGKIVILIYFHCLWRVWDSFYFLSQYVLLESCIKTLVESSSLSPLGTNGDIKR